LTFERKKTGNVSQKVDLKKLLVVVDDAVSPLFMQLGIGLGTSDSDLIRRESVIECD
jgi:hypothetical protein